MGKMFIIVSTIILLLVVIQRNTSNNIRLFKRLKNIIFEIPLNSSESAWYKRIFSFLLWINASATSKYTTDFSTDFNQIFYQI